MGPQTYGVLYGVMVSLWALASRLVRRTLRQRQVPFLALSAAFSFVVMMFNVPIPGGSTGCAVGGVLIAILIGPWAALIAISIALVIQALLFGDGGITAIAANCFNIAFIMPMAGYEDPGRSEVRLITGSCRRSFELGGFPQDRHPDHNPAIDEDLNGNNSQNNHELLPVKEFTVGKIPIEGDEGNV